MLLRYVLHIIRSLLLSSTFIPYKRGQVIAKKSPKIAEMPSHQSRKSWGVPSLICFHSLSSYTPTLEQWISVALELQETKG